MPVCNSCGKKFNGETKPGALMFGHPSAVCKAVPVWKAHICQGCETRIVAGWKLKPDELTKKLKKPVIPKVGQRVRCIDTDWSDDFMATVGGPLPKRDKVYTVIESRPCSHGNHGILLKGRGRPLGMDYRVGYWGTRHFEIVDSKPKPKPVPPPLDPTKPLRAGTQVVCVDRDWNNALEIKPPTFPPIVGQVYTVTRCTECDDGTYGLRFVECGDPQHRRTRARGYWDPSHFRLAD